LLEGFEGFVGYAAEGGFVDHVVSLPGVFLLSCFGDGVGRDRTVGEDVAGGY
jgi:hypothetical protein